jgi:hypothetical protein
MKTLPELCREWNLSLDAARIFLRRHPHLAKLATRIGVTRAFDAVAAERIKTAIDEGNAKRRLVAD